MSSGSSSPLEIDVDGAPEVASVALHKLIAAHTDVSLAPNAPVSPAIPAGASKRREEKKVVPLEVLQQHFMYPIKEAAQRLGMCITTLKRCCRHHGINRWPCRRLTCMAKSVATLRGVLYSVSSAEASAPSMREVAHVLQAVSGSSKKAQEMIPLTSPALRGATQPPAAPHSQTQSPILPPSHAPAGNSSYSLDELLAYLPSDLDCSTLTIESQMKMHLGSSVALPPSPRAGGFVS